MAPIREYQCAYCGHIFDEVVRATDPEVYKEYQCRCGSMADLLPGKPSTPRGSFGTTPRNTSGDKAAKFNFTNDEPVQTSFDFTRKG